jgi:hypothetical protein
MLNGMWPGRAPAAAPHRQLDHRCIGCFKLDLIYDDVLGVESWMSALLWACSGRRSPRCASSGRGHITGDCGLEMDVENV